MFRKYYKLPLFWIDMQRRQGQSTEQPEEFRIKLPRGNEIIGIVESRLGGSRMRVRCFDGKNRICRIPGRLKRGLWVREEDYVLVEPWELGGDEKGDIIFKYRPHQVELLRRKGFIKEIVEKEF